MKDYNINIIRGHEIRGEQLRLARARSIYAALVRHCYAEDVSCYINNDGDEIIRAKLICLEVPDEPVNDIRSAEEIAIICHKEDMSLPEVYALRKNFPTELPHSNARPYARPVSLCISDITFLDIRPLFNAYDYITSIRRWFSLNSENKLHEDNRPLEVFFAFQEMCCLMNVPRDKNPYARYTKKSNLTSTLDFVEKRNATHYTCWLPTEKIYASNFARIPRTLGDLQQINSSIHESLTDTLLLLLQRTVAGKATLPLLLLVYFTQQDQAGTQSNKNLFVIKTICSPSEVLVKKRKLSTESFEAWFYQLPVEVAMVLDMTSRQENVIRNGVSDTLSKIAIIGSGTLGSALTDHFVREGITKELVITDFDFLFPHNICRHILPAEKVMTSKVKSIKDLYKGIFAQKLTALEGNYLSLSKHDKERMNDGTQLIIDVSTSIAVERHLSREQGDKRRCTSFLNPKGDDLVLLMEDAARTHTLDLLEMDYYRNLIEDHRFEHHLEQTNKVSTNTFSCREESVILNYENVRILAGILSQQIRKHFLDEKEFLNVWHLNMEDGTVESLPMSVSAWSQYSSSNVTIYLSSVVEAKMKIMYETSPNAETGGCLFGSYDRDYGIVYIYYMVEAPKDSIHTPVSFVRGFGGLTKEYERITALTYHQVRYLGEWHSHPNMPNSPSTIDEQQFNEMKTEQQSQDLPFIQIIYGKNGLYVRGVM